MKIDIKRLDDKYFLEAVNEAGNKVHLDASQELGGTNQGFRPMQLLLAAVGSCSAIDIISMLKKQREKLDDIRVIVNGERQKDATPSLFTEISIHFILVGNLDPGKVKKAVDLSVEKYCSVARTLEKTATITHSFEIIAP